MKAINRKESEDFMKKIFMVLFMLTVFLCGCQANKDTDMSDYKNDISKAQGIAIISADTSNVIDTITSKEDIEDFVASLELDKWTLKELPTDAKEVGSFGLSQEETIKLGQTVTDGTLYDVGKITLYDFQYIDFEIAGLSMTFEVNEETAEYLNGFF
jgi:hypothetical protein